MNASINDSHNLGKTVASVIKYILSLVQPGSLSMSFEDGQIILS
jgi:hypothetical protein